MKALWLSLLFGTALHAQSPLTFYIDSTNGSTSCSQLQSPQNQFPSSYPFQNTPIYGSSDLWVDAVNSSNSPVVLNAVYVGDGAGEGNLNYLITGLDLEGTIAPGRCSPFTLHFAPKTGGTSIGYLQAAYTVNGVESIQPISILQGTGTAAQVTLACQDSLAAQCDGQTPLQPSANAINFGATTGVPVGSTYPITFTVTNSSSAAAAISLQNAAGSTQFSISTVPPTIGPASSASFIVTFSPSSTFAGPSNLVTATLVVGSSSYALIGTAVGAPGTPTDSYGLQVKCAYQQSAQPISGTTVQFGPYLDALVVTFSLVNPNPPGMSFADITLPQPPSISGSGFAMTSPTLALSTSTSPGSAVQSGQSLTIHPGYTLTFQVKFTGTTTATATLAIADGIAYTLTGQAFPPVGSPQSDLPGITLMCALVASDGTTADPSPCPQTLGSQQTVKATLQVSAPTTGSATLALTFDPDPEYGLPDDPAISFTNPQNARFLGPIFFTPASLNGVEQDDKTPYVFRFQTGCTAGTITITLTDAVTGQTLPWPIAMPPQPPQFTINAATRESPNLVVKMGGCDNTYSAGNLSFVFTTTTAGNITVAEDATSAFHQYFFTSNTAGGAFSLAASFPVFGDVTQVTSVAATLSNPQGQSPQGQSQPFQ